MLRGRLFEHGHVNAREELIRWNARTGGSTGGYGADTAQAKAIVGLKACARVLEDAAKRAAARDRCASIRTARKAEQSLTVV